MARLHNKVALVTGAASGIGAAIAKLFVAEGAFVIASDIDHDAGEKLAHQLGKRCIYHPLDVGSEQEWQIIFNYMQTQLHHIDVLVNNAGIIGLGHDFGLQDPEHLSLKDWNYIQAINATSVVLGCKFAIQTMKHKGGTIVNIASRSGLVGVPHTAAYAASKAAIRNYTKSVALYCAEKNYNIRCNAIHPAAILTPLWDHMLGEGEAKQQAIEKLSQGIPLKHMGEPIDVANAALYLASDESKYITGTDLIIDGGILAGTSASPSGKGK